MYGFVEVITLLLALSGFGVDADPKAPTGDTVLKFAVEDADAVVHLDTQAFLPRNIKVVTGLPDDASVKQIPELLATAKEIKANVEGVRGMAKAMAGVDPFTDISSATAFVSVDDHGEPQPPLIVLRGSFPSDLVKKVAKMTGATTAPIDGRDTMELEGMVVGTAKDGALIAGPRALVEPRVDDDWKAPRWKRGSLWSTIDAELDAKPVVMVALKARPELAKAARDATGDNFLSDLIAGHELAIFTVHHDGIGLYWKDRSKAGMQRVALAAEGVFELLRAANVAPRAMAKLAVAALPSYAGKNKTLDQLIARKDDLIKLVDEYSGDGKFDLKIKQDAKARTVTVRATGKKLSDVLPATMLLPGVVAALVMRGEEEAPMPPPRRPAVKQPARKAPPPPPTKGGLGTRKPSGTTKKSK